MSTLDKILELLGDGEWHNLEEINKEVRLQKDNLEEIIGFFAEYRFVQLDKERRRVKLTSPVLEFFTQSR